jgi:hypothetical protein
MKAGFKISRPFLLFVSLFFLAAAISFLWSLRRTAGWYNYTHRRIYQKISVPRLQALAGEVTKLADTLGETNALIFTKASGTIPMWAEDLDPVTVFVFFDTVEVQSGLNERYGFLFKRSEAEPNLWDITRYDGTNLVMLGTYNHRTTDRSPP